MLEHFPNSRYGAGGKGDVKSDPQLVWTFEESDVNVKSFEIGADVRGCSAFYHLYVTLTATCPRRQSSAEHGAEDQY
jgi:hypothetical protein